MNSYRKDIINFYNREAERYKEERNEIKGFDEIYKPFIKYIKHNGKILDFGCGSGRDSLYFKNNGYKVIALDGSKAMCDITRQLCNIEVKEMFFEDFKEENTYDGIWACASLLHLPKDILINVLKNLALSLKENGYIYASFKYGDYEGIRNRRYFIDFTEESFKDIIKKIPDLEIIETYQTNGVLKSQIRKHWLNIVLKKRNISKN